MKFRFNLFVLCFSVLLILSSNGVFSEPLLEVGPLDPAEPHLGSWSKYTQSGRYSVSSTQYRMVLVLQIENAACSSPNYDIHPQFPSFTRKYCRTIQYQDGDIPGIKEIVYSGPLTTYSCPTGYILNSSGRCLNQDQLFIIDPDEIVCPLPDMVFDPSIQRCDVLFDAFDCPAGEVPDMWAKCVLPSSCSFDIAAIDCHYDNITNCAYGTYLTDVVYDGVTVKGCSPCDANPSVCESIAGIEPENPVEPNPDPDPDPSDPDTDPTPNEPTVETTTSTVTTTITDPITGESTTSTITETRETLSNDASRYDLVSSIDDQTTSINDSITSTSSDLIQSIESQTSQLTDLVGEGSIEQRDYDFSGIFNTDDLDLENERLEQDIKNLVINFRSSLSDSMNLTSTTGLPCIGSIDYGGQTTSLCLSQYESQLSKVGPAMIFIAYFIAAMIILRR